MKIAKPKCLYVAFTIPYSQLTEFISIAMHIKWHELNLSMEMEKETNAIKS